MNESMEENSLHAILGDEDGFGGHYGTADDNDHGYFQHSIDMSGQTSFTGTGGGEEIRLVLPSSPHMNSNRPGTNLVPMSLAPSGTSPHSQAPYPGFLFPPSQQMPAGRNPGSVGSSPAHSGASSPLLSASSRFKEKKKRRRLTSEETRILVEVFDRTQKPNGPLRKELAGRLNMTSRAIQIWFQNRRAKVKRDTAGGESESGIEMSPPPEETGLLKSEYSSAAVSAVGTPLGSAPGSSHSTPNHTPPASVHGTPNNKRSQKFSLAHSVADSLLAKNAKARSQNVQQTGSAVRVALPGSPQPPGGIGAGKNVPLAPRPMGPIPIVPGQNYGQAPQGTFPSQQPYYVHQPAPPIQPQHQHVLLQLHQQHKQQLHLQQFQQQQSDDKNRNNDHNSFLQQQQNSHDRPGNQFLMSPTRNVGVDPSRLSRIDAPGEDRMDLDVYPMMTDETMTLSYDEYSTRVAHQERLSPFLFESNPTYLPSVDPELASPTTAQFLSSFLTSAERSVLADTEPPATGANPDTDLFDPFQMFTRGSGDDINLLLMQDAANSPSGRRRYSIGVNSTYEPVSRQDASLEYFPRRSRSLADIFDGVPNPLSQRTASRPLPPSDEYWNDGFQRPEESLFDSILSEPSGAPTSSAFDMDTSDMFKSAEIAPPAPVFDSSLGRNSTDFASSVAEPHRGLPVHVRKKLGMPNSPSRLASSLPLEAYTIPSTSTPPTLLGAVPSPRAKRMRSIDDNIDLLTQLNLGLTLPPQGHGGSTYQGQPKEKRGFAM